MRCEGCELGEVPAEVFSKLKLRELLMSRNLLASIPADIGKLKCLKTLRMDRNLLASIPAEVGQLTQLTTLDLSSNNLTALPTELGLCVELQVINLIDNPLSSSYGDRTLSSIYYGTSEVPKIPEAASRDPFLKKCTRQLLAHLRQLLEPEQCGHVKQQLEELKKRDAQARLLKAMMTADGPALQKAVGEAEVAGVQVSVSMRK